MSNLLILAVVVLGVITLVQLIRVFELSSKLKEVKQEETTSSENRTQANLWLVFMVSFFAFVIWLFAEYGSKTLPIAASEHGVKTDALLDFNHLVIVAVFFVVNFLLFFFAYKYVYRKDRKALFFTHSNKLELIWTVVPSLFLAVIIIYGLMTWNEITDEAPEDAIVVELYSKQFDWTARYTGQDGELGAYNYKLISTDNAIGIDKNDPNSSDDIIVKGEFHIPVNKPVKFLFRSQDVIHSAYMPHFRAQMNTVPGMRTQFHFTPTITSKDMKAQLNNPDFEYVLLCNKICGSAHYNMQMTIVVDSEEEYNKWLSEQKGFLTAQN